MCNAPFTLPHYPYFMDEETKAQSVEQLPQSPSEHLAELGFEPGHTAPLSVLFTTRSKVFHKIKSHTQSVL